MKGVPVRIEIGPRDIENNQCMIVRRDTLEKAAYSLDNLAQTVQTLLDTIHQDMYNRALALRDEKTYSIENYDDFVEKMRTNPGFAKGMWCGEEECEDKIKVDTSATIRCMPFEQEDLGPVCHFCGKPAKHMVYVAKSY